MTEIVQLISPVDGRVYAERRRADAAQLDQALAAAAAAQAQWKRRPLSERAAFCSAAVDAMLAMKAEIVPELAWQMGRPIRFGAGELRGFEERARHMIAIAPEALAAIEPAPVAGFSALYQTRGVGYGAGRCAVELPLSDGGEYDHSGVDGGQQRDSQTRHANAAGGRTVRRGVSPRQSARRPVPQLAARS